MSAPTSGRVYMRISKRCGAGRGARYVEEKASRLRCGANGVGAHLGVYINGKRLALPHNDETRGRTRVCQMCPHQLACEQTKNDRTMNTWPILEAGDIPGMQVVTS